MRLEQNKRLGIKKTTLTKTSRFLYCAFGCHKVPILILVILCCFMLFHVISCHFMSFHVISCHFMSFHVISCHFMSYHVILCHFKCHWNFLHCHSIKSGGEGRGGGRVGQIRLPRKKITHFFKLPAVKSCSCSPSPDRPLGCVRSHISSRGRSN
jgi:hypothetical protein